MSSRLAFAVRHQREPVATPGHGRDRVGAEQLAQRQHLRAEVVVLDHPARPDQIEQLTAIDHPVTPLDQRQQQIERTSTERRRRAVDAHPALLRPDFDERRRRRGTCLALRVAAQAKCQHLRGSVRRRFAETLGVPLRRLRARLHRVRHRGPTDVFIRQHRVGVRGCDASRFGVVIEHVGQQHVPAALHRLHDPVFGVAEGGTHVADRLHHRSVGDHQAGPDGIEQLFLRDDATGVARQMLKHGPHLRAQIQRNTARIEQNAAAQVEHALAERELVRDLARRVRAGPLRFAFGPQAIGVDRLSDVLDPVPPLVVEAAARVRAERRADSLGTETLPGAASAWRRAATLTPLP